jgi:hypothetical protein
MGLQEKLNAMKKDSMASRPPEVVAALQEEVEKLVKSGKADKAIKPGEALPEFSLPDDKGNLVSSKDLLSQGPLSVSFYRGVW